MMQNYEWLVLVLHHDWLRSTLLLCIVIVIKKVTLYTRCPVFSTASVQKWIGRLRHWNKCHFWPHRLTLYDSTSLLVLTLPSDLLSSDPTYLLPPSAVPFCQSAHHRGRRGGGVGFVILASSTLPCSSLSLSFPSVALSLRFFSAVHSPLTRDSHTETVSVTYRQVQVQRWHSLTSLRPVNSTQWSRCS